MTSEILHAYLASFRGFRSRPFQPFDLVMAEGWEMTVKSLDHIKIGDEYVGVMTGVTWSNLRIANIVEIRQRVTSPEGCTRRAK